MPRQSGGSRRVTITDVARESGFAPSTVSIVLNDAPLAKHIAAKTKEHIIQTAQRLGYRPDAFARSLRNRRSNTVGVLVFDLSDPFCTLILRGIETALQSTGFLPILMNANNDHNQLVAYLDLLMGRRVEAVIVVANWLLEEGGLPEELRNTHLPTMVVGRDLSNEQVRSIIVENDLGGYLAVQHLYDLGHRDIAVIRGPETLSDATLRWQGIQRFAAERNLTLAPELVRQVQDSMDPSSGFEAGLALTQELLREPWKFTALIAFDDLTALGAVRTLHAAGLRVPEDCSVVGFDDIPPAYLCTPPLTTVRQPMHEMGKLAAECILSALQAEGAPNGAPNVPILQRLAPVLIERQSSTRSHR